MPTLQDYRQALASGRDFGGYVPFTATSTSATSTASQEIISTAFTDDTPNISSRYAGAWVYGVRGGTSTALVGSQRQLRPYGLDSTTGTLYTTRAFGSTPQSGHQWELYFRIPAQRDEATGRDGYRELINEALRSMAVPDRIAISSVTDQTRYPLNLNLYPWLREPGRIVNLWRPTPHATDPERMDPQAWHLVADGEQLLLHLTMPYRTGETFFLEVLRPANSRLRVGGVWVDQTAIMAGLASDTDEAICGINDVVTVARELAYGELMRGAPEAEVTFWERQQRKAASAAAWLKFTRRDAGTRRDWTFAPMGGMTVWR